MPSPAVITPEFSGPAVRLAVIERCGFNPGTLDAPKPTIEALGGVFKPMNELRCSAMSELLLLREVFNLIVGAGGS